jgi:hypothetical protein
MGEAILFRLLSRYWKRACSVHPCVMVLCWMIAFFGWDAFGRNQSSSNERKLEEELLRRQWAEMEKEAEQCAWFASCLRR